MQSVLSQEILFLQNLIGLGKLNILCQVQWTRNMALFIMKLQNKTQA